MAITGLHTSWDYGSYAADILYQLEISENRALVGLFLSRSRDVALVLSHPKLQHTITLVSQKSIYKSRISGGYTWIHVEAIELCTVGYPFI